MKDQSDTHGVARKNQSKSNTNEQKVAQPEGTAWQFYFICAVIALGILGLVGKALGLF